MKQNVNNDVSKDSPILHLNGSGMRFGTGVPVDLDLCAQLFES